MRPLRPRLQTATLATTILMLTLGRAFADPPESLPPSPMPPVGTKLIILEGESRVFQADDSVLSFAVADPRVCSLAGLPGSDKASYKGFALQGLKRGVSQVTLAINVPIQTGPTGTPVKPSGPKLVTYPVVVIPDPNARKEELDQLANFVRREFPDVVDFRLVGVPGSPKVIVSGLAPDQWTASKIFETIISDRIRCNQIVNRLRVVCPPPAEP
jgi:hypothetical protein